MEIKVVFFIVCWIILVIKKGVLWFINWLGKDEIVLEDLKGDLEWKMVIRLNF